MIETKYVKKITCDACGFSKEVYCDEDSMTALSENTIDWMNIRFDRLDTIVYTYKHLCPKCAEKFLAMFEKDEDEKKEDKHCCRCWHFRRYVHSNHGYCSEKEEDTNADFSCEDFLEFIVKKPDNLDADGNEQRCDKCFYYEPMPSKDHGVCNKRRVPVHANHCCSDYSGM